MEDTEPKCTCTCCLESDAKKVVSAVQNYNRDQQLEDTIASLRQELAFWKHVADESKQLIHAQQQEIISLKHNVQNLEDDLTQSNKQRILNECRSDELQHAVWGLEEARALLQKQLAMARQHDAWQPTQSTSVRAWP